ncbi:chymotrypsin-1-like [Pectinophora gossypiella]|uniref:Peptidase S1 domain-containing protein n=1 Tax=Pectinophora gossypiella TaxID=13191 RepID=A0A1E1WV71_PECGO|nr:chymotrypsin-1-like [Pectinophora gossypiella]
MGVKVGILLVTLLSGSFAVPNPTPQSEDSDLFYHVNEHARIVGGVPAEVGSVPYMVAMSSGLLIRSFLCGGSVISARSVLTAAHCIQAAFSGGSLVSSLRVTVGTNRWNTGGSTYALQRNVTHQNYVHQTIKNDIGLLITSADIQFNAVVAPVQLSFSFVPAGVIGRAAGWGRTRVSGGSLSAVLLELQTLTIDGQRCVEEVPRVAAAINMRPDPPPVEPHIELCTFHSAGHGMCNGDSGSALVRVDNGQQIGIVSWGLPCARGAPDMFVRVSAYESWLRQHVV